MIIKLWSQLDYNTIWFGFASLPIEKCTFRKWRQILEPDIWKDYYFNFFWLLFLGLFLCAFATHKKNSSRFIRTNYTLRQKFTQIKQTWICVQTMHIGVAKASLSTSLSYTFFFLSEIEIKTHTDCRIQQWHTQNMLANLVWSVDVISIILTSSFSVWLHCFVLIIRKRLWLLFCQRCKKPRFEPKSLKIAKNATHEKSRQKHERNRMGRRQRQWKVKLNLSNNQMFKENCLKLGKIITTYKRNKRNEWTSWR